MLSPKSHAPLFHGLLVVDFSFHDLLHVFATCCAVGTLLFSRELGTWARLCEIELVMRYFLLRASPALSAVSSTLTLGLWSVSMSSRLRGLQAWGVSASQHFRRLRSHSVWSVSVSAPTVRHMMAVLPPLIATVCSFDLLAFPIHIASCQREWSACLRPLVGSLEALTKPLSPTSIMSPRWCLPMSLKYGVIPSAQHVQGHVAAQRHPAEEGDFVAGSM